jgi:hypothetical protein
MLGGSIAWLAGGVACWICGEHVTGALLFIAAGVWYEER